MIIIFSTLKLRKDVRVKLSVRKKDLLIAFTGDNKETHFTFSVCSHMKGHVYLNVFIKSVWNYHISKKKI